MDDIEQAGRPDLSVVMPCLNEEANLAFCIQEAQAYFACRGLSGEILVVDNGSTDRSAAIAADWGAVVVPEHRRGYGRALRTGLARSTGKVIIMGDCDSTYDFLHLDPLYLPLAEGAADMMIGDRFGGQTESGAMPFLHRLGVPFLSLCGRLRWHVRVRDFHCGIRGLTRFALEQLELHTDGMEFATEQIAEAARKGFRIGETPVPLRRSRAERKPKLRTFRDGFRHLKYILTH